MARLVEPYQPERFVEITSAKRIKTAIDFARATRYPSLITGKPGTGKTTALQHFSEQNRAVYCHVGAAQKTVRGMLRMIINAFGQFTDREFISDLQERAYDVCYRSNWENFSPDRFLVVDEVQTLDLTALRELLNLQETCCIPLVLAGNTEKLARTQSRDAALDQILSRIGKRVALGEPSTEDCHAIGAEFNVEGVDAYEAITNFGRRKSIRDLVRLIEMALNITGSVGSIRRHHIENAMQILYGDPKQLRLLEEEV